MSAIPSESPDQARYINLTTFRKDGRAVVTPVWVVAHGGKAYAYTLRDTHKVKRLRNNPRVRMVACDIQGKREWGPHWAGTGRVVEEPELARRVYAAFGAKYGLIYRLMTLMRRLRRGLNDRVLLELDCKAE